MADVAVFALKEQLEKAKESLDSVDENIRRLTGRDPGDRGVERRSVPGDLRRVSVGSSRGRGPLGQRQDAFQRLGPSPAKRANLGSAFSRLGGRVGGPGRRRRRDDSDEEDALPHKPAVQSFVVAAPKSNRTRKDSIEEQNKDSEGKRRNRRMFGLLLGTLQQFKQDASHSTDKDKRRGEIEQKLEQKQTEEKQALANERKFLFLERKAKQAKLEELEQLMALAKEQDDWDKHARNLSCFIRTKAKPHIFYRPRRSTQTSSKRLDESKELISDQALKRRLEIEEEIKRAGTDDDADEERDLKRRKSGEIRAVVGKEGDRGKTKEKRRHSEGRGKDDEAEGERSRRRSGHGDERDAERRRHRSGRSRSRSRSRSKDDKDYAGGDGVKGKDTGGDGGRSRSPSKDRNDEDKDKDKDQEKTEDNKEDDKKAEANEKEEGEVMDTDSGKPEEEASKENEEVPPSESAQNEEGNESSNEKEETETQEEEKEADADDKNDDTKEETEDNVPMEEGETKNDGEEEDMNAN